MKRAVNAVQNDCSCFCNACVVVIATWLLEYLAGCLNALSQGH